MTTTPIRLPGFVSPRRALEQRLADLHRCSDIHHLRQIHAHLFRANLHQDPFVAPKLLSALSLCRQTSSFLPVFDLVPDPNTLLYNTLIRAFASNSLPLCAFSAFQRMRAAGVVPDSFTYSFLLKACVGPSARCKVRMVHAHVVKLGFGGDIFVPNSLIDSYSKCGGRGVGYARRVFDEMPERDVVSWNSIIAGLARSVEIGEVQRLFEEMPEKNSVSWNIVLDAYAKVGDMDVAFELFGKMPERNVVSWSTMISGYSRAGDMDMARALFDRMPVKNLVPWTIIISGYAEKGLGKNACDMYDQFEKARLPPDLASVVSILAACAESGLLGLGKRIHSYVKRTKLKYSTQVCNSLMDMYAKSGVFDKAMHVFNGMSQRDLVSWNVMIQSLAAHGHGKKALELFSKMTEEGFQPDSVTFIGVLSACSHAGLEVEARHYFVNMEKDYGVVPVIEHYGCMVDLLGRRGYLKEAFGLVQSMPMKGNAIILGALLNACRMYNNVELAEKVVDRLTELEISDAGNFAIMSNIYASAGRWPDVAKLRLHMKTAGTEKSAGSSFIEVDNAVNEFTAGDRSHPQSHRIYKMIDALGQHLKQAGYVLMATK